MSKIIINIGILQTVKNITDGVNSTKDSLSYKRRAKKT
jgi:hypothetical protein